MDFLVWVEHGTFASWVRESTTVWGYPTILFLHTVGMSALAGLAIAVDLRLLGVAQQLPLEPMNKYFPLMWLGFWINLLSGTALLMADATTKLTSPVFGVKMAFVAGGLIMLQLLRKRVFLRPAIDQLPLPFFAKMMGATSLLCWLGAITAGRLMAYLGPVSGLPS
jgi:hypothetical protein